MGRVVWWASVSLDGYMAGPQGELDWHMVDAEVHAFYNEHLGAMGAFLDGRVTHELMSEYWPTADEDPDATPEVAEFARIWRAVPKIVYSRTRDDIPWATSVVHEVVPAEVEALKASSTGDLSLGGPDLATTFRRLDLIDEYGLLVTPIVLGEGRPMFPPDGHRTDLRPIGAHRFANGVELHRYVRA